jgi:hypothetical protein
LIPVWDSSVWYLHSRTLPPTMPPMFSPLYSRRSKKSPERDHTPTNMAQTMLMALILLTELSLTTSEPCHSPSPTVPCPTTTVVAMSFDEFSVVVSDMLASTSMPRLVHSFPRSYLLWLRSWESNSPTLPRSSWISKRFSMRKRRPFPEPWIVVRPNLRDMLPRPPRITSRSWTEMLCGDCTTHLVSLST